MMPQLTFDWPAPSSYDAADFIVCDANRDAVRLLDTWPAPAAPHVALISGPVSCGKTHLAHRWAREHHGVFVPVPELGKQVSAQLWAGATCAVLDNVEAVKQQEALFHLLRHAESHPVALLLTARVPAQQLPFRLPDLCSRLRAVPHAAIQPPDDSLLHHFIAKCFADRQLRVSDDIVQYLLRRTERSFAAAQSLVQQVERWSLQSQRAITVPLVREALKIES